MTIDHLHFKLVDLVDPKVIESYIEYIESHAN